MTGLRLVLHTEGRDRKFSETRFPTGQHASDERRRLRPDRLFWQAHKLNRCPAEGFGLVETGFSFPERVFTSPGTRFLVPRTSFRVFGNELSRSLNSSCVPGTSFLVLGTSFYVPGNELSRSRNEFLRSWERAFSFPERVLAFPERAFSFPERVFTFPERAFSFSERVLWQASTG